MKFYFVIILGIFLGCSEKLLKSNSIEDQKVDTVYVDKDKFRCLSYDYNDLINLKRFKKVKVTTLYSSDLSYTYYTCIYEKDTFVFVYNYTNLSMNDRSIILNGNRCSINRLIMNNEEQMNFNDFNCDYSNADFYLSDKCFLIISSPSNWTGKMSSIMKFYQLIDKENNTCNEFFLKILDDD